MQKSVSESARTSNAPPHERGLAVAMVALTRYLAFKDPSAADHFRASLANAAEAGLAEDDLQLLRLLVTVAEGARQAGFANNKTTTAADPANGGASHAPAGRRHRD